MVMQYHCCNTFEFILWALFFFTLFIYKKMVKKKEKNRAQLPPGPKPWPLVGSLFKMLLNKPTFRWIHKLMDDFNTEIMCIRLGSVHVITVSSPEIACEFFKKHDAVFASRPLVLSAYLMSNGFSGAVVTPFGDQWKKMRRIISSTILSQEKYHWLKQKRDVESDNLVSFVYKQCFGNNMSQGGLNLRNVLRHHGANVMRQILFNRRFFGKGKDDGGPGKEEEEFVPAVFTLLEYLYAFCVSDYMPWLRKFDLDGHKEIFQNALNSLIKYHSPIIDGRIQLWKDGLKKEQEDILDVLITLIDEKGQKVLTPTEIKAHVIELTAASVDNPSNAIEWALAEMLNQPKLLQKAWDELDVVVGRERLVQESDLPRLNYVKACLREAFRLHPVAPFNLPHVSLTDANVAGYFIPKGSHVLLSRPGLGRNPRVWDEPLKFKPERHIKDDGSEVVLYDQELHIMSFSTGRRGCPGVSLGSTMSTMSLARLLQCFTWSLPSGVSSIKLKENKNNILLANPLHAVAKPRLPKHVYPVA